jgi:putative DNA primase/helicase
VFPADATKLAYEVAGWLMVPDTSIQKAVLLTGDGGNGKSTYLAALLRFVGGANAANLSLHKIETDKYAASRLVGKLANICPDLPSDHLASTSTFKAITGGDKIAAERKYTAGFDFQPFARLVFSANNPPRSGDASHAFYRRWLVVPFDRTFGPNELVPREVLDARLADPKELSGVLNKALVALRNLRKSGEFSEAGSTRDAHSEFRTATDPFSVWLDRNTVEGPEAVVGQDELRQAYNQFCEQTGKPGKLPQAFGRALSSARPHVERSQRMYKGEPNVRVYLKIGLVSRPGEDA